MILITKALKKTVGEDNSNAETSVAMKLYQILLTNLD
jgi:hypothetical protein